MTGIEPCRFRAADEEAISGRMARVNRASRRVFALITLLLACVFIFCHGCHAGDHDDELVIHWLDRDR
jgi:hypothetical protein